jgi:hypothetical protein
MFMARTVQALFPGGQRLDKRELGWNLGTIRKGMHEVKYGIVCVDGLSLRGRKRSEDHLPTLLSDITAIVDGQSQADPQCRHHAFVYAADGDGSAPPIDRPEGLHRRGITHSRDDCDQAQHAGLLPKKSGQKSTPKKLPETDAIFAQVKQRVLRLDIVDKSTSPLQTHLGPVFGDEAVQRGLLFLE